MIDQPMSVPAAPVTLLDIYTRQVEFAGQLALINERLAAIPDHEHRIRRLETFRAKTHGIAVTVSLLAGLFSGGLGYLLGIAHH